VLFLLLLDFITRTSRLSVNRTLHCVDSVFNVIPHFESFFNFLLDFSDHLLWLIQLTSSFVKIFRLGHDGRWRGRIGYRHQSILLLGTETRTFKCTLSVGCTIQLFLLCQFRSE
ncbi:hypothetical protein PFISCL1PPCAC_27825, partial [Pristionchus fissidentatus]